MDSLEVTSLWIVEQPANALDLLLGVVTPEIVATSMASDETTVILAYGALGDHVRITRDRRGSQTLAPILAMLPISGL